MVNAHMVQSLEFAVAFHREDEAFETQSRLSDFLHDSAKAVIASVFDEFSSAEEVVVLDRLEIDLGTVSADDIKIQWQDRLPEKLREVLRDALNQQANQSSSDSSPHIQTKSSRQSRLEALTYFLVNGHVSWRVSAPGSARDIAAQVVSVDVSALVNWLGSVADTERALTRLVSQLGDHDLIRVLGQLAPTYASDLAILVSAYLNSACTRSQTGDRRGVLRNRIWKVLLQRLLAVNHSSSVLDHVLEAMLQVIEHFDMLDDPVLMDSLSSSVHGQRMMPRRQLAVAAKKAARSPVNMAWQWARLRRQFQLALTRGERAAMVEVWQDFLRSAPTQLREYILQKGQWADIRQRIAHLFSDAMLHDLVKLLVPTEAGFIELVVEQVARHCVSSANRFDENVTEGQGDAATSYGSYRVPPPGLKVCLWEFTLTHLLVDRGSTFNRRSYMSAMLQMMALREAIDYSHLLQTMADTLRINPTGGGLAKELLYLLEGLEEAQSRSRNLIVTLEQYEHVQDKKVTTHKHDKTARNVILVTRRQFSAALLAGEMHTFGLIWRQLCGQDVEWIRTELYKQGHSSLVRHRLASILPESLLEQIAELLVPQEGEFIAATINSVAPLTNKKLIFVRDESVARRELWEFTLTYFLIDRGTAFNKRSYMHSMLQQMAARESMDYVDILHSLRLAMEKVSHPGQMQRQMRFLVDELVGDSQRHTLRKKADTISIRSEGLIVADDVLGFLSVSDGLRTQLIAWLSVADDRNWQQVWRDWIAYEPQQLKAELQRMSQSPWMRQRLIDKLPLSLASALQGFLLPQENEFIVAMIADSAVALTRLQDRTEGGLQTTKHLWEFTLTFVLTDQSGSFNRRSYATYLLQKLAARSGIDYQDLLREMTNAMQTVAASQGAKNGLLQILLELSKTDGVITPIGTNTSGGTKPLHAGAIQSVQQLTTLLTPATTWSVLETARLRQLVVAWPAESVLAMNRHLELLLRERAAAFRLIDALSASQLSALLHRLRPADHYELQRCVLYIAAACRADFGMAADARLQRLQWQFIFRYLFEEGRRFWVADFGHGFAMFLVSQLPASTNADWVDKLLQKVASKSENAGDGDRKLIAEIASATKMATTVAPMQAKAPHLRVPGTKPKTKPGTKQEASTDNKQQQTHDDAEPIYIINAGLVMLSPYLPRLFDMLGLLTDGRFVNEAAIHKAILVSQFAVNGTDDVAEEEMMLNKILCGAEQTPVVVNEIVLDAREKSIVEGLLQSVITHWSALGNTSVEGLRQSFLEREGRLLHNDDGGWDLLVEVRAFDMLLDRLPWGFATIKYSWMQGMLHVEWR